jgi:two-component system response regulator HydG
MTERVAPAAEFDAIARIAAGLLDAPIATVTALGEHATRLGGCGVSWPAGDEEPLLRWITRGEGASANPLSALDLTAGEIPGKELMIGDGVRGAMVVPLRDAGAIVGAIAIYAPGVLEASQVVRRRLVDLAEVAAQLVVARRELVVRAASGQPVSQPAAATEPPRSEHAERRILELVKQAADRIVITDEEGKIVYANPSLARARSRTPAELVGRSIAEFNPPELQHLPGLDRVRRTGHDPLMNQPFVRQIELGDGRRSPWEIAGTKFTVDGASYVGFIARDLSAASQRLAATMESVSIAIAHVSLDGQFLRFNDHFETLVGRSAQELRAYQLALDVAPPADQRGLSFIDALGLAGRVDGLAIRAHLTTSDDPYEIEYQLVRPDATKVWIELSIALVRDSTSRPAYFVVVGREVTTRHRVDVALRGLVEMLTSAGSALFERACSFLGATLGARCVLIGRMSGASVQPIAAWRDGAPVDLPSYALVGTPCETVQHSEICYYPERLQALFPDDHMLVELGAQAYLAAPLRTSESRVIGLIAVLGDRAFDPALRPEDMVRLCATRIATDLERIDAIAELETREEQLRQITETAQETFWLAEWPSRGLLYVSPGFEILTGRTVASVYTNRETWSSGLHPDDRERVDAAMKGLETTPVDLTARVIRADGQLRWVQIRVTIVRDRSGRAYRVAGSFEDITRFEEARRALEERERELAEALEGSDRELEQLQHRLGEPDQLHGMVGSSRLVRTVYRRLRQAAHSNVTVLITGESGTGKELAANALHALSARGGKPFVAINCAAIPEPLLESELFGHVKGAFTGASRDKVGLMQAADGGTLFLDEIGDMSLVLQVKLLRALQERQIRRVGDENAIPVDVRLVSASHRDLRALVADGRMREDFYYRIKVFAIDLPALRDRREDIPALANHFAAELGQAAGKPRVVISAEALRALLAHRWPGNVRELRNAIEHALVTVAASTIQLKDLPLEVRDTRDARAPGPDAAIAHRAGAPAATAASPPGMRERIEQALRQSGGNRAEAARILGIGRVTLWKRMRRLGMTTDDTEHDTHR